MALIWVFACGVATPSLFSSPISASGHFLRITYDSLEETLKAFDKLNGALEADAKLLVNGKYAYALSFLH